MAYEIIDEDERITLEETFGFRGGNTWRDAVDELKNALKSGSFRGVPDNAVIYATQVTPERYEAYIGIAAPKKETTNSSSLIIHGNELERYIARLPGKNLEGKLRNIKEDAQQGQISKRAARAMIDTLKGYNTLKDKDYAKDKSLEGSLL